MAAVEPDTTSVELVQFDDAAGSNDAAGGGRDGGGLAVSLDAAEVYVNVEALSKEETAALGVPTCCSDSGRWWRLCGACCVLTVIVPLAVLLPLSQEACAPGDTDCESRRTALTAAWCALCGAGVLYVLWSLRATLTEGAVCMPAGPPRACSLVATDRGPEATRHAKTTPKKVYVVYNPHGGRKRAKKLLDDVVLPIWRDEFGLEATVLATEYAGHARDLARTKDLSGYDGFCVIGGDGSFHEVVNGLGQRADGARVPVGLLPGGSGNSVSLDLGTWSVAEAARRVGRGDVVHVDANRVTVAGGRAVLSVNELSPVKILQNTFLD